MRSRSGMRVGVSCIAVLFAIPPSGVRAGDRLIGAEAPTGAFLVKHFNVPAGAVVVGVGFTSNDPRTVFPKIIVLRGPLQRISEGTVLADVTNVRSVARHRVLVTVPPIALDSRQDVYVALALPPSNGIRAIGDGTGVGAIQLQAPAHSYFAAGVDDYLGEMDVEYELELVYQAAEKPGVGAAGGTDGSRTASTKTTPNPFNPSVVLELSVPQEAHVEAWIYDVAGRRIRNVVGEVLRPGIHRRHWDGLDERGQKVSAGIYFIRAQIGEEIITQKLVLTK